MRLIMSRYCLLWCILPVFSCTQELSVNEASLPPSVQDDTGIDNNGSRSTDSSRYNYDELRARIYVGRATILEVKRALTEDDPYALTNTIHALFAMRWHRGVYHLINDMWKGKKSNHPQLAWQYINSPPARIALASTINRDRIVDTDEHLDYIRSYKHDGHAFNRAQTVIALGFNGDPADIPYIKSMADGDSNYVAQTAITSLALMVDNRARDAMIALSYKYKDTSRGDLLLELLKKSYAWSPDKKGD